MAKKKKKEKKLTVIDTYTDSITYTCPIRGEITEIATINRYNTPYEDQTGAFSPEIEELLSDNVLDEDEI